MSLDQTPGTPRFADQLEQVLRDQVEQRAVQARRAARRRRITLAVAPVAVAVAVVIALAVGRDHPDDRARTSTGPQPSATHVPDRSSTTSTTSSSTSSTTGSTQPTTTTTTTTTTTPAGTAVVAGDAGGPPPCAPELSDYEGASIEHPERAPFIDEASFPGGVRWAICGASPAAASDILNLRSDDNGATWSVTDTGLDLSPFHGGDRVDVTFTDATSAEIRLVSLVAERDDRYRTTDGGRTWRLV
jgi:hypothetical protein